MDVWLLLAVALAVAQSTLSTTPEPPTNGPTTAGPTTSEPTTAGPTTAGPTTAGPTTAGPPTAGPTTAGPPTAGPTTAGPTTAGPATAGPTTAGPTPTTPKTTVPTTTEPPTTAPTTTGPTTTVPTTTVPTTTAPTTTGPTTTVPTTTVPTTTVPSTTEPPTTGPTTTGPTTTVPTTTGPTTAEPTTTGPTTTVPTTTGPTTTVPTTTEPPTTGPATTEPPTTGPTTTGPATTEPPTTGPATTGPPTTGPATTVPTTTGPATTGPTSAIKTTSMSNQTTSMSPNETTSMPNETTSMSPTETTSMSPNETTSMSPNETTSMSPTETTSMSPNETTSMSPNETTSTSPNETTSTSPNETTSMSPNETTSMPPTETTSMSNETTSMSPNETTSMSPNETTSTSPTETTSMSPNETTSMSPNETTSMSPNETTSTSPTETTSMSPNETTSMSPNETTSTSPTETTSMSPNETTSRSPTETTSMSPNETTSRSPTETTSMSNETTSTSPTDTAPTTSSIHSPNSTAVTQSTSDTPTATTASSPPTPPPTMTSAHTTAHLVCDNDGVLESGVCICPDEWTGLTCSEENFCSGKKLDDYTFPSTPISWFAYSEEICPLGSISAGKPKASTRCSKSGTGPAEFERPLRLLNCEETLSDIHQNLTDIADLETLASSTQLLTSRPEELTAENVTTAAQIANTLLLYPNATEGVRVAAVATVSQLLSAPKNMEQNNATLGLTLTLDQLSLNLSSSLNTSQSQVVQPNLVVQSAQVLAADTQGVQFTSITGQSGNFVAERIRLNTNTSAAEVGQGFIANALIYVRLPAGSVSENQEASAVSMGFVLYQNDNFFRSRRNRKRDRKRNARVCVLSASVQGRGRHLVPQHVELQFRPALPNGTSLHDFACVFWDYGVGDWSTAGCSKGNSSAGVLSCFCNHTTNFAALWSYRVDYQYSEALNGISTAGLSLSLLGLVLTIVFHIKDNFQRGSHQNHNSRMTLLSIYVSLLVFIIIFLSGVQNRHRGGEQPTTNLTNDVLESAEYVAADSGWCTAVAALLHFFLLATFTWNAVYGTQLLLLVRTTRTSLPPHCGAISAAMGWGVPAVVMATTLGVTYRPDDPLDYRQEEFCWLSGLDHNKRFGFGRPLFWGFVLPVGLILVYNTVLLVLTALTICKTDPHLTRTKQSSMNKKFLTCFSLAVILGVSWSLGYLVLITTGTAHLVLSVLFCLCTTTQGLQIFILFTARKASFKASVSMAMWAMTSTNYRLQQMWSGSSGSGSYKDLGASQTASSSM